MIYSTNVDRQLSDLNACSPAGQIRLITANKDKEEYGALLSDVTFPASGPFLLHYMTRERSPKNNWCVIWKQEIGQFLYYSNSKDIFLFIKL